MDYLGIYIYRRIGHDQRILELKPGGKIGRGSARLERRWRVSGESLFIEGNEGVICVLYFDESSGVWQGKWEKYGEMPIELVPFVAGTPEAKSLKLALESGYYGVGEAQVTLAFDPDGCVRGLEDFRFWAVGILEQKPVIRLFSDKECVILSQTQEEFWSDETETFFLSKRQTETPVTLYPCSVLQPSLCDSGYYKGAWSYNVLGRSSSPQVLVGQKGLIIVLVPEDPEEDFTIDLQIVDELRNRMEWDWNRLELSFQYQIKGTCTSFKCYWVSQEGTRMSHLYGIDITEGVKGWRTVRIPLKALMGEEPQKPFTLRFEGKLGFQSEAQITALLLG